MDLPHGHTRWLGATFDSARNGTNFAFYTSAAATRVELSLFDKALGESESARYDLTAKEEVKDDNGELIGYIWHGFAHDVGEGQLYGLRVHGVYDPSKRQYFNPNKLLIDPCAKAVTGEIHTWEASHYPGNSEDNAAIMPKARVVDWLKLQQDAQSDHIPVGALYPHADTNILEMHVKGATILHPDIAPDERGTYKALSSDAFIGWVKEMGYTTVELMPVESFGTDAPLAERGMKNYWGYMTMAPMAPHTGYAATDMPERELAQTIRTLKQNGIEVVLDVVPNHTLESGRDGPVVNLRGMDDTLYLHNDYTGTGNTRDFGHPINRRMFLEELKYWQNLGVSGFRIDLATVIGRVGGRDFDPNSPMVRALRQDYEDHGLRNVKFYGEPWDLGPNGVQQGRLAYHPADYAGLFSNHIAEWDGRFRDTVKDTALHPDANPPRGQLIMRLSGSSDTYDDPQKHVVKIASHDGPTLEDAVSYRYKHNEANGEDNRDGNDGIANWGVVGETNDPNIIANSMRMLRFAIAMLMLSQGIPMLSLGHERRKSQRGNTNAYCQDNHTTYIPWGDDIKPEGRELMEFTRMANQFRAKHPSLRRARHFSGQPDEGSDLFFNNEKLKDVTWLDPLGGELKGAAMDWPGAFGMLTSGDPGNSPPDVKHFTRLVRRSQRDQPLLIAINPTMQDIDFRLPDIPGVVWKSALNSQSPSDVGNEMHSGQTIRLGYRTLVAFEGQRELAMGTPVKAAVNAR